MRSLYTLVNCYLQSLKYKKITEADKKRDKNQILIVSYLLNFNKRKLNTGIFISDYWGDLPNIIKKYKHKINWLHMSTPNSFELETIRDGFSKLNHKK